MADGKWIRDLRPDMPLAEAAQRVLAVRLAVVQECLPRAVLQAELDPENVHQLRVSTRRADAALRIFKHCLPKRVYKSARQRLRGIRRAAGSARDWDVFVLDLCAGQKKRPSSEMPGQDFLIGYALGQRAAAQSQLEAAEREQGDDFAGFVGSTQEAVRPPHDGGSGMTLVDLARPMLARLLHDLEQAALGDLKDYNHLHQVRICGKRLRYAMEVFADCFPADFRERLYPLVEEMQDILGRANDSHVAGGRLSALRERLKVQVPEEWGRVKAGVEGLLRFHQRRLPQERRRFVKWWEGWRKAGAHEALATMQAVGQE
jgi:CHAD domain-containing protein